MKVPEKYRVKQYSNSLDGNNGVFKFMGPLGKELTVIASDDKGWDHVSVSVHKFQRLPLWVEMQLVKDMFFGLDETVVQFHPAQNEYVNNAEVLHLWKKQGQEYELPPSLLVGIK